MEPVPKPINISSATSNGDRHRVPKQASSEVEACLLASSGTHRHQMPGEASSEVEACLLHPQAHIGIKCQEKPPVRLKSVSAATQPARNMAKNAVSGVRPEEEPQGSIWFLTQAILLFPQHPPAMDNSSQQEDRIPTSAKHASMCLRPSHAKKIG